MTFTVHCIPKKSSLDILLYRYFSCCASKRQFQENYFQSPYKRKQYYICTSNIFTYIKRLLYCIVHNHTYTHHVPLSTDVGPNTEDDIKVLFLGREDEVFQALVASEEVHSRFWFMCWPLHNTANHTHSNYWYSSLICFMCAGDKILFIEQLFNHISCQ